MPLRIEIEFIMAYYFVEAKKDDWIWFSKTQEANLTKFKQIPRLVQPSMVICKTCNNMRNKLFSRILRYSEILHLVGG